MEGADQKKKKKRGGKKQLCGYLNLEQDSFSVFDFFMFEFCIPPLPIFTVSINISSVCVHFLCH